MDMKKMSSRAVVVREVWRDNLESELLAICRLLPIYPVASLDTEFPGTLFQPEKDQGPYSSLSCQSKYFLMKKNVDALKVIQLGLALSDWKGNLSTSTDGGQCYVWQFNFRDFDLTKDPQNSDSIRLLQEQGIDFEKNREYGISSYDFRRLLFESGLVNNLSTVTWVTFQSSYDFGLMIKILTRGEDLPDDLEGFMARVRCFFGFRIFDVKHLMKFCNSLFGGLEKLAQTLDVPRVAGKSHQAGSDSLLTLQTFFKLVETFFVDDNGKISIPGMSILHGFEQVRSLPPAGATCEGRGFPIQQPFILHPWPVMVRPVIPVLQPIVFPFGRPVIPVRQPVMMYKYNPRVAMVS